MGGWWMHTVYEGMGAIFLVAWIFWVLFSITLHELGHGWAAIRQGDDTPIAYDRMTLNPVVHMGTTSLIVFALIGIAWGVMPVNPSRFRQGKLGRIKVAAAGPATNLALMAASFVLFGLVANLLPAGAVRENAAAFLLVGCYLNLVLCVFNLIPVPPLDGSTILASLSLRASQAYQHPNAPLFGLAFIAILFWTPLGAFFWSGSLLAVGVAAGLLQTATGGPSLSELVPQLFGP